MTTTSVLIVEDERIVARSIEKQLKAMGYSVVGSASTGEDAVRKAVELRPDLILMDISLGAGIDGVEAAGLIHKRMDVPVVYLTAHSDEATLQRANLTDPFGFVLKPYENNDLQTAIVIGLYRHKVQRRLRENEEWLAATLGSIGDGVIATDERGRVRFMNAPAERLTGWTQADALGRDVREVFRIVGETSRQPVRNPVLDALEKEEPTALAPDTILIDKAGAERPIEDSAAPIRDVNGRLSGAVLVFRDITGRKREEAAAAERVRLAAFGRDVGLALAGGGTLPDMLRGCADAMVRHLGAAFARIWTHDAVAGVLDLRASAGMYTHTNGPHGRVPVGQYKIGKIASERKPHLTNAVPDDPRVSDPEWARREGMVAFAGYPLVVEDRLVGVMALFARCPLSDTALQAMASVANEVAVGVELRRAQDDADRQREWLRVMLKSIGDAVVATDTDGRVAFLNPVAQTLTGWTSEDAVGRPLDEVFRIVNEGTRQPIDNSVTMALREGRIVGLATHTILIAKNGTERPIDDRAAPIRDERGNVSGAVLVFRDITERRRLEVHLRQAQRMEAIGRLAGGIAHDFNNIMTIITGYSEILLADGQSASDRRDFVRHIHDAGQRAAGLTQQIMAFSRKQMLVPSVLNLNAVVRDLGAMVKRLIGSDIEFVTDVAPDLGDVKADPTQIGQAVLNLAANARDAMPKGGRLVVATSNVLLGEEVTRHHPDVKPGWYVLLSVADTGRGMSADVLAQVFEPFFTTKGVGQGTGLGLATVYGIVKQSGGHIEASSKLGEGTTFRVYLPLVEEPKPRSGSVEVRPTSKGGETILLVEDEDGVRRMTKMILLQNGYDVLEASNGKEALAVAERHTEPIRLVLTDLVMPDMSGRVLAERLSAMRSGLRVLFMSGSNEDVIVEQGVRSAAVDLLPKPFSLASLTSKVREVLDRP